MNVRTIFLISMIFCAAPVVCAAPKVSLTKQKQGSVKKWVNNSIKKLHPMAQQAIKTLTSLSKDYALFALSKMSVGKSIAHYEKEIYEFDGKRFLLRAEKECEAFQTRVRSNMRPDKQEKVLSEMFNALYSCPLRSWLDAIFDEKWENPKGKITKAHIVAVKRLIVALSFMLKCL